MDPYATHLPVLRALGATVPIRCVLEFGAGLYSTREFLDRACFPTLEHVWTIEDDAGWSKRVHASLKDSGLWDGRCHLIYTQRGKSDALWWAGVFDVGFDLVFVDDGKSPAERVGTIGAVVLNAVISPDTVVVIHDYDNLRYQQAAAGRFEHEHIYTLAQPWTAILWNGDRADVRRAIEGLS